MDAGLLPRALLPSLISVVELEGPREQAGGLCPAGLQSPHQGHHWLGPDLEALVNLSPSQSLQPNSSGSLPGSRSAGTALFRMGGLRSLRAN